MSNWTGQNLKTYLRRNDSSVDELAPKLGRTRGTVYTWLKLAVLDKEKIDLLKEVGIDLDAVQKSDVSHETKTTQMTLEEKKLAVGTKPTNGY